MLKLKIHSPGDRNSTNHFSEFGISASSKVKKLYEKKLKAEREARALNNPGSHTLMTYPDQMIYGDRKFPAPLNVRFVRTNQAW